MRILENTTIDFVGKRRTGFVISGVLIALSLFALVTRGLEAGIDFQGGTEFVVQTDTALPVAGVREALTEPLGRQPEVKEFGAPTELLVRTSVAEDVQVLQSTVLNGLTEAYPEANPAVIKVDTVGPRFAEDLKRGAIYAVLASLAVIFGYIMIRFTWRFSLGAVAALAHDVVITLGIFAMFHHLLPFSLQIDQTIIAALLTIVGYSINDTVVIFDRIREYLNQYKTEPVGTVINRSINATLSRTLMTSGTTLIVVLTLFLFGGEVLRGFAFALLVGIVVGTYSSVFVAAPVVLELRKRAETTAVQA